MKLSYEFVKSYVEEQGYKLLSKTYKNNKTNLLFKCPSGHQFEARFDNFKGNGSRCPVCAASVLNHEKRHTYEYVNNCIEERGEILLSKEYINSNTKLNIRCGKEHIYSIKWNDFQQGHGCPICGRESSADSRRHSYEYVKDFVRNRGYQLLSKEYEKCGSKLELMCKKGHPFYMSYDNFRSGQDCPVCWKLQKYSKTEKKIYNIVKECLNCEVISNDRTQLVNPLTGRKLELDIWIPSLRKAIEFNGIHWHSKPEVQERDKIKRELCLTKNIDLLIINEESWINNRDNCLNNVFGFLGVVNA